MMFGRLGILNVLFQFTVGLLGCNPIVSQERFVYDLIKCGITKVEFIEAESRKNGLQEQKG